ncbi:MAG: hypothetical protein R6V85_16780 [Polyangia bacterium]
MHTLGLVLGLLGLNSSWIPHWGWLGVAASLAGCLIGLRSIASPESRIAAVSLGASANVFGGWGLLFGLGVQIKTLAPRLDALLVPLSAQHCALLAGAAVPALAGALVLARFKSRPPGLALALVALVALHLCAASALVHTDREMGRETAPPQSSTDR